MTKWFLLASLLGIANGWAAETITVAPGHQHVIAAPNVIRAAIGNPAVADVKAIPKSNQVIVTGIGLGSTDLILWTEKGEKRTYTIVVKAGGASTINEVNKLLQGIEGINVKTSAGRIILDGQIYRSEDLERVRKVLSLYPQVVNLTRVNPRALDYFAKQVEAALGNAGFKSIEVRSAGDTLYLEGEVNRKSDIEQVNQIASSIYSKVSNQLTTGIEKLPLILVDVKLMEVRKASLSQTGIRWPGNVDITGSAIFSSGGSSAATTIGQGATATLLAMIEKGDAKVLANPKLLCRSGTPASFLAGGEIPIRLIGERTANVIFKQYGISLQITAHADRSQKVSMDIDTKVSDLDSSTAVEDIPGILEHNVKTALDLGYGETVVLAGLVENRSRKNVQKVPFLGHIPILGELFKSRSFQNNESEFLVFLTPHQANSTLPIHSQSVQRMKQKVLKADEEIQFSILD